MSAFNQLILAFLCVCVCVCVEGVGRREDLHQNDLLPSLLFTEIVGSMTLWISERTNVLHICRGSVFTEDGK